MSLNIEQETKVDLAFDAEMLAYKVIMFVLEYEKFPYAAEINLTLLNNAGIQERNKKYRNMDKPTDVLSFPLLCFGQAGDFSMLEDDYESNFNPDTGEALLGDILISIERMKEQAKEYGHSERREFAFLLVHSMLHLLGYDHVTPQEAAVMEKKQDEILEAMKIPRE
ncbi:MAG: rRNA maturation RNase YbeY [Roseburia sp.]